MIFKQIIPKPPLDKYIQNIVYYRGYKPEHDKDKFLPDCTTNLVIDFQETPKYIYDNITFKEKQECKKAWFSGMHTEFITISSGYDSEMMVITFKPGCSYPFVKTAMDFFNNKVVDAEKVFCKVFNDFRNQLISKVTFESKIEHTENWLMSILQEDTFEGEIINHLVEQIKKTSSSVNLKSIAKLSGYSQKQFIHLFKKFVGITPKQFHRIVRFNEILSAIHHQYDINWLDIATDCGYYDQAHFIKDFQAFSGLNPKQYIDKQGEWPHYIPVR
jgi:methylphosphotriester-DNA--protein-cysteine methyltransferase